MLSDRPIEIIKMPLAVGTELLHPERVVIVFNPGVATDIGAFCYRTRGRPEAQRETEGGSKCRLLVDLDSLDLRRVVAIRKAIRYLSDLVASGSKSLATSGDRAAGWARFVNYAEGNGYEEVLTDSETVRDAFRSYVMHLRERVSTNTLSAHTAAQYQFNALDVLSNLTGTDTLDHGVDLVRTAGVGKQTTEPPSEKEMVEVLSICHALFEGLSTLCLENRPYPFALAVPSFLDCPGNLLWIFPHRQWVRLPWQQAAREKAKKVGWGFDYEAGTVSSFEDIKHHYCTKYDAARAIETAEGMINDANATERNLHRTNAAFTALNAFLVLFLASTGMNWSSVTTLAWSEDYEISVERQGFRTIKFRAGDRTISIEIQGVLMPSFKKFLKLREYLLGDRKFDRLFISRPQNARETNAVFDIQPLTDSSLYSFYEILSTIRPNIVVLASRKFRAAKADWLLKNNIDPKIAATVLQNSLKTVLRSYAAGTFDDQEEELTEFFDALSEAVIIKNEQIKNSVDIAVGVCLGHGSPNQRVNAPISSDCETPEGCLFCDKHKVHADERDIRKLASCKYCIEKTSHLADSEEQFQALFKPIFDRIQNIFDQIERRLPGAVSRITREVESGELDPYWSSKLELLINLGLTV
jgi:hypothetical protein